MKISKRIAAALMIMANVMIVSAGLFVLPEKAHAVTTARLYFSYAAKDTSVTPTTRGAWDQDSSTVVMLRSTQEGVVQEISASESTTTNNWDILLLKGVSAPIGTAVTISGTGAYNIYGRESSASMNAFSHVHAWVMAPDGSNRGTLVTDSIGGVEWSTGGGNFSGSPAVSSVSAQVGDRVVVEVGLRAQNTSSTAFTGATRYGADGWYFDLGANVDFNEDFGMPTFRSSVTDTDGVVSKPTGLGLGDLMIALIAQSAGSSAITAPAGWTQIFNSGSSDATAAYYRQAEAADVATSTYTFGVSGTTVQGITAFKDVASTSPVDQVQSTVGGFNSMSLSGITPSVASTTFVEVGTVYGRACDPQLGGNIDGWTITNNNPVGWGETFDTRQGAFPSVSAVAAIAYGYRPATGASGTASATGSSCGVGGGNEGFALLNLKGPAGVVTATGNAMLLGQF